MKREIEYQIEARKRRRVWRKGADWWSCPLESRYGM